MLAVETVVRSRREHAGGKSIKAIARDLRLSRKVVRKAIRAPEGAFDYHRAVQPLPRIGPFQERLDGLLAENEGRHRRDRLRMTRVHDLLLREGFEGSYDAIRRYAARWSEARRKGPGASVVRAWRRSSRCCSGRARRTSSLGWDLPPALARLRRKLGHGDEADRRFVRVLAAVLSDGLDAVESAIGEALDAGAASDEVILNILSRRREPHRPLSIVAPEDLALLHPPVANCARYDTCETSVQRHEMMTPCAGSASRAWHPPHAQSARGPRGRVRRGGHHRRAAPAHRGGEPDRPAARRDRAPSCRLDPLPDERSQAAGDQGHRRVRVRGHADQRGLVRSLHAGSFLPGKRNIVLVGGTGTGKTHLAIAITA